MTNNPLLDLYRCPSSLADFDFAERLSCHPGFFRFEEATCFGHCAVPYLPSRAGENLWDASTRVALSSGRLTLPFDPREAVHNLRYERYIQANCGSKTRKRLDWLLRKTYYSLRPLLGSARKYAKRIYYRQWKNIAFPQWPVDCNVEKLLEALLITSMEARGISRLPFIWFWPDGYSSCLMMTHDVETERGRDFCSCLMDLDEASGVYSSFQIIPEERYHVPHALLDEMFARGFEVNIHDLNHDGRLFQDRREFEKRAARINHYVHEFTARGFRSGALYREPEWFAALEFSYDMSIPNVGHLEAQAGGCCTVFPYHVGSLLELPLTTTQDYALFHLLNTYSINLWKQQVELIMARHGLISFIVHPDYLLEDKAKAIYLALLRYLAGLRSKLWVALPGAVDQWWRARSQMELLKNGEQWEIHGPLSERARIAYARIHDHQLVFECAAT